MEYLAGIAVICIMLFDKKPYHIKYDRKDYKNSLTGAVIATALKWLCLASLFVIKIDWPYFFRIVFPAQMLFGFIAFVEWARFLDCILYFKRLWRLGYEIPERKELYGGLLEHVPRMEKHELLANRNGKDAKDSKQSILLAVLSWLIATAFIGATINYWGEYKGLDGFGIICLCVFGGITLAWIGIGGLFWRQKSAEKYCDDVNENRNCKPRLQFVQGITIILIVLFLSIFVGMAMNLYSEIIQNIREESYQMEIK